MLSREGIAGLVCLVGSLVLLAATWGLPGPTLLVPVGPGFYPRIILGITAVLSLTLIVTDYAAQRRRVLTLVTSDPGVRAFAFTFGP